MNYGLTGLELASSRWADHRSRNCANRAAGLYDVRLRFVLFVVDIDECATEICDQGCENQQGSYRCFCNQGYRNRSDSKCLGE